MKIKVKKIVACLLAILVFGLVGCTRTDAENDPQLSGGGVDDYTQFLNETFNSTTDLSDCQGYRNWYYYCGDPEMNALDYMVYNTYYGRWCSKYHHLYTFTYMWGTVWLPDGRQGYGVGMGFKMPASGTVDVSVTLRLLAKSELSSGDGVVFVVSDKAGKEFESVSLTKEDGAKDLPCELSVNLKKDEEILFMLYANSNNTNDFTNVDITINYRNK